MAAVKIQRETEAERIAAWRAQALERAGYTPAAAAEIASRFEIDLHRAVDMVERGCPPELAREILV